MVDSYRPAYEGGRQGGGRRDDRPIERARRNAPPRPQRSYDQMSYDERPSSGYDRPPPPGPPAMTHFGGPSRSHHRFSESGFTQSDAPPPQYPARQDEYARRSDDHDYDTAERRKGRRGQGKSNTRGQRHQAAYSDQRPRYSFAKPGASERKLLQPKRREATPPQLEGMNDGKAGVKYIEIPTSSEDEEEETNGEDDNSKKEPSPPKWSNPETYTALPPADDSQRKRKDVLKLIRKARMKADDKSAEITAGAVAANDDFISLGFDDGEDDVIRPHAQNGRNGPSSGREREGHGMTIKGLATNGAQQYPLGPPPPPPSAEISAPHSTVDARLKALKRKRVDETDDDTRPLAPPSKSLKLGPIPDGRIVSGWSYKGSKDGRLGAVPWVRQMKYMAKPEARLHQEIVDFHAFVSAKKHEDSVRADLLVRLNSQMDYMYPGSEVHIFGSFAAGLYLPDADMDVVVVSRAFRETGRSMLARSNREMRRMADMLRDCKLAEPGMEVITGAKVPLIKFVDKLTSLKVDMSFENNTGIIANDTFRTWKAEHPAMPIIVMVIKQFLLMRGLNDVALGGIGGFTITCLVTNMLAQMPRVQSGELNPMENLGEVLIEFLDLYGNRFNYERTALRMNPPSYDNKDRLLHSGQIRKAAVDRLMVIDPNRNDNDIAGGSRHIRLIADKLSEAKSELFKAMDACRHDSASTPSLLAWMLGGDYDSFAWYRRNLKRVHNDLWGPVRDDEG